MLEKTLYWSKTEGVRRCILYEKVQTKKAQKKLHQRHWSKMICWYIDQMSVIEFDPSLACSIKFLPVKKNQSVAATTSFFSGKMLMLMKLSLRSFVYELAKIFFFHQTKRKHYTANIWLNNFFPILSWQTLTVHVSESNIPDEKFWDILFDVICENEILNTFDTSHEFWEKFSVRNTSLKK